MGSLTKHGFVRNNKWELAQLSSSSAHFSFPSPNPQWEGVSYTLTLIVSLFEKEGGEEGRGGLRVQMKFVNQGGERVEFGVAFHTYFSVEDVSGVWVGGLKGKEEKLEYIDNADGRKRKEEVEEKVKIEGEVDRIYLKTGKEAMIHNANKEEKWRGVVVVTGEELGDKVVWNPGKDKCEKIGDLGDEDYKKYLCVEAGQVEPRVGVEGGGEWEGEMELFTREEIGGKL